MEHLGHDGKLAHVGAYRLYVRENGTLVMSSGNVKITVTPQEARDMLELLLVFSTRFASNEEAPSTNGYVPQVSR